jgi:hypothetical protein
MARTKSQPRPKSLPGAVVELDDRDAHSTPRTTPRLAMADQFTGELAELAASGKSAKSEDAASVDRTGAHLHCSKE